MALGRITGASVLSFLCFCYRLFNAFIAELLIFAFHIKLCNRLFQQPAALSSFFHLCEKTGAHHGVQLYHGALRGTVYRLAECRLQARLAETEQTIPDQVHKPTARPTMLWVFQCFEGIELLRVQTSATSLIMVLRLEPVHRLILSLLGSLNEKIYNPSG